MDSNGVFAGDDHADVYVNTRGIVDWVGAQRARGANVIGMKCAGGYHELDNEHEPMGEDVRTTAAKFLANGANAEFESTSACERF